MSDGTFLPDHTYDSYVDWILFGGHVVTLASREQHHGQEPWAAEHSPRQKKRRVSNNTYTHSDRIGSPFYVNYLGPGAEEGSSLRNEQTNKAKKFRRRFRVPYSMFESICSDIREMGLYRDGTDASGNPVIPLKLLVLACLRHMGSGCPFDLLMELTCIHEETIRRFFHNKFCIWGVRAADESIRLSKHEEELLHVMGLYKKLGLPGCVGSIDCVHIVWEKCRAGLHNQCKGKEDHPTLVFEVVASHTKRILSVSQYFWGATNDKTIARYDAAVGKLRSKQSNNFLSNVKWISHDRSGTLRQSVGAYFICDGGYHDWECLVPPFKHQVLGTDECEWSKHVESMRKDVECVFGILKKRFLLLKHPVRLHDPQQIQNAFVTCCVVHNLLLDYDGYDDWELRDRNWENDQDVEHTKLEKRSKELAARANNKCDGFTRSEARRMNPASFADTDEGGDSEKSESELFHLRRSILIDNFKYLQSVRQLRLRLR